ncbi:MAG: diguanylate cyclase [Betaproteobacteria bacterium]|nr:diguanylate cyclase [Betaproteobacteria bacterium]
MSLIDAIETQMICNRLPLAGISVAALPCAGTPIVLSLHWHGFIEHEHTQDGEVNFSYEPVPSSCLQCNEPWLHLEDLDHSVMDVAWELGSWDLTRQELRPYMRPGAPVQEALECTVAFGQPHRHFEALHAPVSDVPDAEEMLALAARRGYLRWHFRPVRGGIWEEVADDRTLEQGGYRNPPCPVAAAEIRDTRWLQRPRTVVYRFGCGREFFLPRGGNIAS